MDRLCEGFEVPRHKVTRKWYNIQHEIWSQSIVRRDGGDV